MYTNNTCITLICHLHAPPPSPLPPSARRDTHPTRGLRRRTFRVQQARSNGDLTTSDPSFTPASFSMVKHTRQVQHVPLVLPEQPVHGTHQQHQQQPSEVGLQLLARELSARGGGGGESDVRRGGRIRKQVHATLSEDKMAAVNFGHGSDDDDGNDGVGTDAEEGQGRKTGGEAPLRFRASSVPPWGSGSQPLIKVSFALCFGKGRRGKK